MQLRGKQLRDLIFRKEGETEVERDCYVKLTFATADPHDDEDDEDDEDGELITFARKISATGGSAYMLNDRPVSWDRYSKALAEIGVHVTSRKFLVFQGDVESIAGMAPKDLTTYFEKVSSSDELKERYQAAEASRNQSEDDYIFHFQKKKGMAAEKKQIKEQQEEANKFRELVDIMREKEVESFLHELFHVQESVKSIQAENEASMEELEEKEAARKGVEEKMKATKKDLAARQREQTVSAKKIGTLEKEISKQQPQEDALKESIKRITKRTDKNQKEEAKQNNDLADQQALLRELRGSLDEVQQNKDDFEKSAAEEAAGEVQLSDEQVREYEKRKEQAGLQTTQLQSQVDAVARKLQAEKDQRSGMEVEMNADNNKLTQAKDQKDLHEARGETVSTKCEALSEQIASHRGKLKKLQEADKERQEKTKDASQRRDEASKQLQEAKADRRANDKDRKLSEAVEAMKRHYPGVVHGRIIDLCKPTQRKYNLAVTVAMGRHMDAVVVATEQVALQCVQYLKQQRLAAATFIPLDTIQVKPIEENARRLPNNAKLVLDVISYDPALEKAIIYAVGTAVVMESLDAAREFAYGASREKRRKTVTTDGTMIHKAGLMTGGSSGEKGGLQFKAQRWDQKEYDALKRKRDVAINELIELERAASLPGSVGSIETLASEIDGQERQLKLANKDLALTKQKKEQSEQAVDAISKSVNARERELMKLHAAIKKMESEIASINKKKTAMEDGIFADLSEEIGVENFRQYEETMLRLKEDTISKRSQYTEQISKLENQIVYEKKRDLSDPLKQLEQALKQDARDAKEKEKKMSSLSKQRDQTSAQIDEAKQEEEQTKQQIATLEETVKSQKKETKHSQNECKGVAKDIQNRHAKQIDLQDRRHDALVRCMVKEVPLPRVDTGKGRRGSTSELISTDVDAVEPGSDEQQDLFGKEEQLSDSLDFRVVKDSYVEEDFEKVHRQYGAELKEILLQTEQLAPNHKAEDRMADVTNRLDEVAGKFDSAKEMSSAAVETFESMKRQRFDKFMATFKPVQDQIDDVYKQLTVSSKHPLGGSAYLSTDNTEEPYLHPVKYNAMPPNKRFRDMEQLSGGEKTVASLALLFAVHSVQPSPFFVLDEVDAALDNANVIRVADYIQKHKRDFQSIVVSHKDTLYHRADTMIGIYRDAEENCSKVLSLDLSKFRA